jgi:predicted nucleotidyltransferase
MNILRPVTFTEEHFDTITKSTSFFARKVDLLSEPSIRNPYLKANIEQTRKLIYDREGEKIFI